MIASGGVRIEIGFRLVMMRLFALYALATAIGFVLVLTGPYTSGEGALRNLLATRETLLIVVGYWLFLGAGILLVWWLSEFRR